LPAWVAPGTPSAWATPPPGPSPCQLVISGRFPVVNDHDRRLHQHARGLGYEDLVRYLQARCQQHASLAKLASELATTTPVIRRLLQHAGIGWPPRAELTARQRHAATGQRLGERAAQLGFDSLHAYLADRAVTKAWPLSQIAGELHAHLRTVRQRLDHHGLRRARPTAQQTAGRRRAAAKRAWAWQAKRQARLAALGFADIQAYLQARRVQQGWPLRRMTAELHVGRAWLNAQLRQLHIP